MQAATTDMACAHHDFRLPFAERVALPRLAGAHYRGMNPKVRIQHARLAGCFLCGSIFCSCQFLETVYSSELEEVKVWGEWQ